MEFPFINILYESSGVLDPGLYELGSLVKVLRPQTRAEEYEYRAKYLKDDCHLAGDGPKATEFRINKVLRLVPFQRDDVVLDISVGKGLLFEKIHDTVRECHGVDVTDSMVERVRRKFERHPNVSFKTALPTRLPYPDAMFDKVTMTGAFCLQDTREECRQTLAEIRRVAKSSATIFISDIAIVDESKLEPEHLPLGARIRRRLAQDSPAEFVAAAARTLRQKLRQRLGLEPVLVEATSGVWFPHEMFLQMCRDNRMEATGFRTQTVSGPSASRFDYLIKPI